MQNFSEKKFNKPTKCFLYALKNIKKQTKLFVVLKQFWQTAASVYTRSRFRKEIFVLSGCLKAVAFEICLKQRGIQNNGNKKC